MKDIEKREWSEQDRSFEQNERSKQVEDLILYIRVNISNIFKLTEKEISIIDFHSIINIMNWILGFIQIFKEEKIFFEKTLKVLNLFFLDIGKWVNIKLTDNYKNIINLTNIFKEELREQWIYENNKDEEIKENIDISLNLISRLIKCIRKKVEQISG